MTLVAGAAIFGYVNSQAGVASQAYGQSVGNSVQYLEEKFTVVDMSWGTTTCGTGSCAAVTIWLYNTGSIALSLDQVRLYGVNSTGTSLDLLYNYSSTGGTQTNRVYDLLSAGTQQCGIAATSYESPAMTGSGSFSAAISSTGTMELIIPPTSAAPTGQTCPSFGLASASPTTTYYVDAVGTYGNSVTYSQEG